MSAFQSKYTYRKGFNFKVPAQVVGETLEELTKAGGVSSAALLDASRDEAAPTHDLFEWDDTVAAERYRLHQATVVINCVQVEVKTSNVSGTYAAFVNVETKAPTKTATFVPIIDAMEDEEHRQILLNNAYMELRAFKKKYEMLTELAGIIAMIDEIA